MKKIFSYMAASASLIAAPVVMTGCMADDPFGMDGEGVLRMRMVINSDVTRAELTHDDLLQQAQIYISDSKGVLKKYVGFENVPSEIVLKSGAYKAQCWTGQSVPATFDRTLYYYGETDFSVQAASVASAVINCKIQNVVVSVNASTIDAEKMSDYTITVGHSGGELTFNESNISSKAYYMMPKDETSLSYTIVGKNAEGADFVKKGVIDGVKGAHEYTLNLVYGEGVDDNGGGFITVVVDDTEILIEDEVEIFSRPEIKGHEFDLDTQVVGKPGSFTDKLVKIRTFGGLNELYLKGDTQLLPRNTADGLLCNLLNLTAEAKQQLNNAGISWDITENPAKKTTTVFITFGAAFLNNLEVQDIEHRIDITAYDGHGKYTTSTLRVANTDEAVVIDAPVVATVPEDDLLAVRSASATLNLRVVAEDAQNPRIRYREASAAVWQEAYPQTVSGKRRQIARKGQTMAVKLTGLKPGTRYEFRSVADGFEDGASAFFTTETQFAIPNASFEEWGSYRASTMLGEKDVVLPGAVSNKAESYWGSGNEGSATANLTLTNKSEDMKHSGAYSARLGSGAALGIIAAGNIFVGEYVKTDGTNGVLSLGRQYDGSHPDKVRVWTNYRPGGGVKIKKGNENLVEIVAGGTDQGQIYAALTTEPVEVRTNPKNLKLFDADDSVVLAYGQTTFKEAFGPDGELQQLDIPLEYKEAAKTRKPLYLVIVVSASKFGDYFCGSDKSVFYLDDFELIYE